MPKKCKKLPLTLKHNTNINIDIEKELNKLGIRVKDQHISLDQEPNHITKLILKFIDKYGEFKTILNLSELWSPSAITRAKAIPRPQNAFMLYRKNISKGLYFAKISMPLGECSKAIGVLWKNLDKESKKFWFKLSEIVKVKHQFDYPNYKFNPKINLIDEENNVNKVSVALDINEINDNIEILTSSESEKAKKSSNIDIDLDCEILNLIDSPNNNDNEHQNKEVIDPNINNNVNEEIWNSYDMDIDLSLFDFNDINYLIEPTLYENSN